MRTAATPACAVVRPGETYEGKQGLSFFDGISAETVGATGTCMHLVTISPDRQATAYLHAAHETAFSVVQGALEMRFGERLAACLTVRAGECLSIPAGMPHRPMSIGATEPCVAVVAGPTPTRRSASSSCRHWKARPMGDRRALPCAADRRSQGRLVDEDTTADENRHEVPMTGEGAEMS